MSDDIIPMDYEIGRALRKAVERRGGTIAVYPVLPCANCGEDRPHHGPFCCSCGASTEDEP